jgi:hypothetical protein
MTEPLSLLNHVAKLRAEVAALEQRRNHLCRQIAEAEMHLIAVKAEIAAVLDAAGAGG